MGSEWSDVLEPEGSDWTFEVGLLLVGVLACFM